MKKLDKKIEQLKSEGWKLEKIAEHKMNNKYYKYAAVIKGLQRKIINNKGGEGGLSVKL